MPDRDHHQAGEAFLFQAKLFVEDRGVKPFDGYRIQAHRGHAQQEVADVQVNLLRHPLVVIFQIHAVHVGKIAAAFVVRGFSFWRGETAVSLFLIDNALKPGIVHRGFRAEHHHVRGIQHFAFVKHIGARRGFCHARFTLFSAGNNKVPRLGVGAGRAVLQQRFDFFRFFCGQFFGWVERLGRVAFQGDRNNIHNNSW